MRKRLPALFTWLLILMLAQLYSPVYVCCYCCYAGSRAKKQVLNGADTAIIRPWSLVIEDTNMINVTKLVLSSVHCNIQAKQVLTRRKHQSIHIMNHGANNLIKLDNISLLNNLYIYIFME